MILIKNKILFVLLYMSFSVYSFGGADYNNPEANTVDNSDIGGMEDVRGANNYGVDISSIMQKTIKKLKNKNGNFSFSLENNSSEIHGLADGIYEKNPDYNITEILDRGRNINLIFNPVNGNSNENYVPNAQVISNTFISKSPEEQKNFGSNKSHLTIDDMIAATPDSNLSKGIIKGRQIKNLLSQNDLIVPEYVNCYISRKLTPLFFCPIESVTANYGGNIDMFQEEALNDCNNACREFTTCVSNPLSLGDTQINFEGSHFIELITYDGITKEFQVSNKTITQSFKLNFLVNQYSEENSSIDFLKNKYFVKYDLSGLEHGKTIWRTISTSNTIPINSKEFNMNIFTSGVYDKLKIKFYTPYILKNGVDTSIYDILNGATDVSIDNDSIIHSIVVNGTINYESNETFYCPPTQFVNSANECGGQVISKEIAGVSRLICVRDDAGEDETGAFYSKNDCERKCYVQEKCQPTYIYPDGEGTMNISSYQAEVGCVNEPSNSRCSKSLCEKLFMEDNETVLEEKNYFDEMNYENTVVSGITKLQRPAVDYRSESSEIVKPNSFTFINEMKDSAYKYMSDHLNYNYSKHTLSQPTDIQLNKKFIAIGGGDYSLSGRIKPSNIAYDDQNKYFYIIVKMWQSYVNKTTSSNQEVDPNMNQDLELLEYVGPNNLHVFETIPEVRYLAEITSSSSDSNGTNTKQKKWIDVGGTNTPIYRKWSDANKNWLAYDLNDFVHPFQQTSLARGNLYIETSVFSKMYYFFQNTEGTLIRNQTYNNQSGNMQKKYSGTFDPNYKGEVYDIKAYMFYSEHPLRYSELNPYLVEKNVFFELTESHKYGKEITGDGVLNGKIEFFLQGESRDMSIYIKMKPSGNEVAKKGFIFTLMK